MDKVNQLMEIGPAIYEHIQPYFYMNNRRQELRKQLGDLSTLTTDIKNQARAQEQNEYNKRIREVVVSYLHDADDLIKEGTQMLDNTDDEILLTRLRCVPSVERYLKEAQNLCSKGSELQVSGLTYNMVRTRGNKLPVRDLEQMGDSARDRLHSVLDAITNSGTYIVGIYGCPGAGKKSLLKHTYNKVLEDYPNFTAVYWAEAPEIPGNDYTLQEEVSKGMWFDIEHDKDCVRRASMLEERFINMAALGRVILFLSNLKQEFRTYEVLGMSKRDCVLVFTAPSLDVCNRMKCDKIIKVDHLKKEEAEKLFMREAGFPLEPTLMSYEEGEIKNIATQIANECARMPLAIRVMANSMCKIDNIHEWRNRFNELMGRIKSINNEEDKILEQLKFGYTCLEDPTTRSCFVVAAQILDNNAQLCKPSIIEAWRARRLIATPRGSQGHSDDQGHTILNRLERSCLIDVEPSQQLVSMNKWIRKSAKLDQQN